MVLISVFGFFFFKQKTAYEMRISDWSSDVCSSDLHPDEASRQPAGRVRQASWLSLYQLLLVHQRRHPDIQPLPSADVFPPARTSTQLLTCAACLLQQIAPLSRSEEHTSELQSLMRISYAVFCLKKKTTSRTQVSTQVTMSHAVYTLILQHQN